VGAYMGSRTDTNAESQVRGLLQPLAYLARQYGPAVVLVAHRRKAPGFTADGVVMGSRAFTGLARAAWHVCRDPQDKVRRLFLPGKQNLAADVSGLAFRIVGEPPRVVWDGEPVAMSADEALAAETQKRGPEARQRAEAEQLLRDALAGGPRPARDVEDELHAAGVAPKTLRRARESLGVVVYHPRVPGPWYWRLPEGGQDAQDAQVCPRGQETRASWENPEKNAHFNPQDAQDAQVFNSRAKRGHLGPDGPSGLDLDGLNRLLDQAGSVDGET